MSEILNIGSVHNNGAPELIVGIRGNQFKIALKDGKLEVTDPKTNKRIELDVDINDSTVTNVEAPTVKAYITATPKESTHPAEVQVFDPNIYIADEPGTLVAKTYVGNLDGNAASATKASRDARGNIIDTTYSSIESVNNIVNNKGTLESLTISKVNVSDIVDNLSTAVSSKVLSANQGVELRKSIIALQDKIANIDISGLDVVPTSRTINGLSLDSDITLDASIVGAAPNGYGLGGNAKFVSELNTCLLNGWYYVRQTSKGVPAGFDYGSVFVTNRNIAGAPEQVVQYLFAHHNSATNGTPTARCQMIRHSTDGGKTWTEAWVNPPFEVDVEYLTIEKREGRAVFKKLGSDGVLRYRLSGSSTWQTYAQEVGAAPTAFGVSEVVLGSVIKKLTDAKATGLYLVSTELSPTGIGGWVWVESFNENCKSYTFSDDIYGANCMQTTMVDGEIKPWDWVNPPMVPGVEYRTTERYNNKAVYKMLDTSGNKLWRTEGEEAWHSESKVSCVDASELKSYLDRRTFDDDETIMLSGTCDSRVILKHDRNNMTQTGTTTTTIGSENKELPVYSSVRKIKSLTLDGASNATVHGFDLQTSKTFVDADYEDVFGRWYYVETSYDIDTLVFKNMTFTDHVDVEDTNGKTSVRNVVFDGVTFVNNGNMSSSSAFAFIASNYNAIKNVVIRNCYFKGPSVSRPVYALCYADTDMNITIENCVFDGSSWNAIQINGQNGSSYSGKICINNNYIFDIPDIVIQFTNISGRFICCGNLLVNTGYDIYPRGPWLVNVAGQDHSSSTIVNNTYSEDGTSTSIDNGRHDAS